MAERTLQSVKQINRNRVFRLIAARQRISKQEIDLEKEKLAVQKKI